MIQNASEYINDGGSDGTVLPEEEPNIVYETTQSEINLIILINF